MQLPTIHFFSRVFESIDQLLIIVGPITLLMLLNDAVKSWAEQRMPTYARSASTGGQRRGSPLRIAPPTPETSARRVQHRICCRGRLRCQVPLHGDNWKSPLSQLHGVQPVASHVPVTAGGFYPAAYHELTVTSAASTRTRNGMRANRIAVLSPPRRQGVFRAVGSCSGL